jgi:hypothetical protein
MKWIKTAIGALIAVLTIGIIATTVYKMTRPSEVAREVSFEIDPVEGKYYPVSAYNKIVEYGDTGGTDTVKNIVSSYVNNEIVEIGIEFATLSETEVLVFYGDTPSLDIIVDGYMDADGNWFDTGSTLTDIVNIKLVFEVSQPPQLTGITATLIVLIPLVFVGGVLLYFYKPLKKE